MIDNKKIIFNGGPFQSYWWADEHEPIHLAVKAELVDKIEPAALKKAWDKTKRVYPVIDLIPDDYDEEIVFFKGEGESIPVHSKNTLKLAAETTLYRGFSLTYFGNSVTLSAYHSLTDEKGLMEVFKTLINFYVSDYTDTAVYAHGVMMKEHRQPGEYFIQNTMLVSKNYTPQAVKLYKDIREIFNDADIVNDGDCTVTAGEMDIPADAFDKLCEKTGTAPDELFTYVMAKSVYNMYPHERRMLSIGIMTDFRRTFNVPETIAPCSKRMPLILLRGDVCGTDMNTAAKNIAKIRKKQKSDDYIKSHVALENTYSVLNIKNACLSINFSGKFDIGEKTKFVKNIVMSDYSIRSVFMIRLGDTVKVSFQYGNATNKYMSATAKTLNELGIEAKVTAKSYQICAESEKPII